MTFRSGVPPVPCRRLVSCLIAGLAVASARGEEVLETDRPDFSESSQVVGADHWQIETSVLSDRYRTQGRSWSEVLTPTLVRIGLTSSLEARIETDGVTLQHGSQASGGGRSEGFADTSLGVKWHSRDAEGPWPSVCWILNVDTPTGSPALRGTGLRPSLRTVNEWELPDEWSFSLMPGVFVDSNDAGSRYRAGLLAVTLGKAFDPAWRGFVEWAGQRLGVSSADGGQLSTLDTGIAWIVTPDVQIDLDAARGLTRAAPRFEWGLGLSVRF